MAFIRMMTGIITLSPADRKLSVLPSTTFGFWSCPVGANPTGAMVVVLWNNRKSHWIKKARSPTVQAQRTAVAPPPPPMAPIAVPTTPPQNSDVGGENSLTFILRNKPLRHVISPTKGQ